MKRSEWRKIRGCLQKRSYPTKEEAEHAKSSLGSSDPKAHLLHVYECGDHYHVGHRRPRSCGRPYDTAEDALKVMANSRIPYTSDDYVDLCDRYRNHYHIYSRRRYPK